MVDGWGGSRASVSSREVNIPEGKSTIPRSAFTFPKRCLVIDYSNFCRAKSNARATVEGAPLALREAALNGCTLVATTAGGVNAILSRLPDPLVCRIEPTIDSLREAIYQQLTDQAESITTEDRERMKETAQALWSWESLGPQHNETLSLYL